MSDHYRTLGISPTATPAEIKKAYRALAFRYHPDKNPGDLLSEARFREIKEAYEILSDTYKRAVFDDERWYSGMAGKTKGTEVITPGWLINVCVQLNASLATMDTQRMSQRALQAYIVLILADAHITILQDADDRTATLTIISEIMKAVKKLDVKYLGEIAERLTRLAGKDDEMRLTVHEEMDERIRKARWQQMLPWFVILITLALCLCMYFFGSIT